MNNLKKTMTIEVQRILKDSYGDLICTTRRRRLKISMMLKLPWNQCEFPCDEQNE